MGRESSGTARDRFGWPRTADFFKGIFALTLILIGIHSYVRNWHPGVTFSILFVVGLANFVYDLFGLYAAILHDPSPRITLVILGRLLVLWFLFDCVRNSGRIPDAPDRFNPFLFLKR